MNFTALFCRRPRIRRREAVSGRTCLRVLIRASGAVVGAGNLCHQVIFVEDAASAVTTLDPEMIQISNAVGQGAEGAAWFRARCGR